MDGTIAHNCILGLSYDMSKYGLAKDLSEKFGRKVSTDEAQSWINKHKRAYPKFWRWKDWVQKNYRFKKHLRLADGWYMFGDNPNFRSIGNVPVQGCLGGDTRIVTKDYGTRKIKDLEGLSRIHVWNGNKYILADCVRSGKKKKTIITFNNGQSITCSPEHKFKVISNRGIERWVEAKALNKGHRVKFSNVVEDFKGLNKDEYPFKFRGNNHELGLCLGRLASDGWYSTKTGIKWIFAEHEKELIPIFREMISKFGYGVKERKILREGRNQAIYHLYFYSSKILKELEKIDLKKSLSSDFIWKDKELMRGFLKGYFDGDGGICGEGNKASIKLSFGKGDRKERYATDIQKMLSCFGIKTRLYKRGYRTDIAISSESRKDFRENIGFMKKTKIVRLNNIPLPKPRKNIGTNVIVSSVELTEELVDMWDIANCPDQTFCAEGLVTHNTGASIMRKAVALAQDAGLSVTYTLHDALYITMEKGSERESMKILAECMDKAFRFYFPENLKDRATVRLDGDIWGFGEDFKPSSTAIEYTTVNGHKTLGCKLQDIYIDERGEEEYEHFKQYFEEDINNYETMEF